MDRFHVSELVNYNGRDCVVIDVQRHSFGWNEYKLWDVVNGETYMTSSTWITKSNLETLNFDDELFGDFNKIAEPSEVKVKKEFNTSDSEYGGNCSAISSARHSYLNNDQLNAFAEANNEKKTTYSTKWAVKIFKEWLSDRGLSPEFEHLSAEELADLLRRFYGEVNSKDAVQYSRSSLVGIRAGLNRHIQNPPFNRIISIVSDKEFLPSNKVLMGRIKINREKSLDVSKHKSAIASGDIQKMYTSGVLSNENSLSLQYKVFFELSFHFGRRGREGLHSLKKNSFSFVQDDENTNIEYATLAFNEKSKKNQGIDNKRKEEDNRMYSVPSDPNCPVNSLKLYLSKLNPNSDTFFQKPKSCSNVENNKVWYTSRPVGVNTLSSMMKVISLKAKLSQIYTNHCIRATTSTVLSHANVSPNDIIAVTGHKDPKSLLPYVNSTSNAKRKCMSSILNQYGKSTTTTHSDYNNQVVPDKTIPFQGVSESNAVSTTISSETSTSASSIASNDNNTDVSYSYHLNSEQNIAQDLAMKIFQGNHISGGNFTVNFNFSK